MKTLLTFVMLSIVWHTQAQILSQQYFVTGSGNFSYQDDFRSTILGVQPSFGYVFSDNLVAGITIPYEYRNLKSVGYVDRALGFGPMVRYYLGESKLKVFPHAEFTYNLYKTKSIGATQTFVSTNELAGAYGALGAAYFFHETAAMEIIAGYQIKDISYYDRDAFRIRFGFSVFFGGNSD